MIHCSVGALNYMIRCHVEPEELKDIKYICGGSTDYGACLNVIGGSFLCFDKNRIPRPGILVSCPDCIKIMKSKGLVNE